MKLFIQIHPESLQTLVNMIAVRKDTTYNKEAKAEYKFILNQLKEVYNIPDEIIENIEQYKNNEIEVDEPFDENYTPLILK